MQRGISTIPRGNEEDASEGGEVREERERKEREEDKRGRRAKHRGQTYMGGAGEMTKRSSWGRIMEPPLAERMGDSDRVLVPEDWCGGWLWVT